ncbi:MAG: hypothetical protein MAGBODY4_01515 [Candidatus Marinimicrobia bacterium]|nr:hypothetical protein [Candidatus Neomarinimicrobiota bacterium]
MYLPVETFHETSLPEIISMGYPVFYATKDFLGSREKFDLAWHSHTTSMERLYLEHSQHVLWFGIAH